ncbi:hypothetical protein EP331_15740 [bacterium]|nr:MAG: hypothetical protein EP331_15740 [bacterium]
MLKKLFWGISLWILSPFYFTQAQIPSPATFSVKDAPKEVSINETFSVVFQVAIEGDWHLYGLEIPKGGPVATSFKSKSEFVALSGKPSESKPDIVNDPNFKMEVSWHKTGAEFTVPLVYTGSEAESYIVEIEVQYMLCNDSMCLPPTRKKISFPIKISGTAEGVSNPITDSGASAVSDDDDDYGQLVGSGVWSFMWIALTAGLAALLTPCVFPMIPLTVSFFSKQAEGNSKKAIGGALLFGLSIIGMFTLLGALLSLFLGATGASKFASNPWVNVSIGIIFLVFAVSLLGLFELQLPYQVTNFLNKKSNESSGLVGILFMGLTISAVSFSCTAPFVGGVLAATTQGEWFYPILGMIVFSAAFASPFVLFAMFPNWLQSLPKSGSWMNNVKVVLGFVELGAAIKFISNADLVWSWGIVSRPFAIAIWIAISILAVLYILGKIRFAYETPVEAITTARLLFSIPMLTFAIYLIPGLLGASLGIWDAWLPPKQATDVSLVSGFSRGSSSEDEWEKWSKDVEASKAKAAEDGKYVFIDFTGYTCTNCRAMEANVFPLSEVSERFEQLELVKLYTDDGADGPKNQLYQFELTGTVALPTYALIDAKTGKLIAKKSGYVEKDDFVQFLDVVLKK